MNSIYGFKAGIYCSSISPEQPNNTTMINTQFTSFAFNEHIDKTQADEIQENIKSHQLRTSKLLKAHQNYFSELKNISSKLIETVYIVGVNNKIGYQNVDKINPSIIWSRDEEPK